MRSGLGKRIIALGLAAALCFGDAMPTFAEGLEAENQIVEENVDAVEVVDASDLNILSNEETLAELVETLEEEGLTEEATEENEEELGEEAEAEPEAEAEATEEVKELEPATIDCQVGSVTVSVTLADKNDIPEGAVLKVDVVTVTSEMEDAVEGEALVAYDIRFEVDGEEVEPSRPVSVAIVGSDIPEDASVFHISEDGNAENMNAVETSDGVEFTTGHFSVYIIASTNANAHAKVDNFTAESKYISLADSNSDLWQGRAGWIVEPFNNHSNYAGLVIRVFVDGEQKEKFPQNENDVYRWDSFTTSGFTRPIVQTSVPKYTLEKWILKVDNKSEELNFVINGQANSDTTKNQYIVNEDVRFTAGKVNYFDLYLSSGKIPAGTDNSGVRVTLVNYDRDKITAGHDFTFGKTGDDWNKYTNSKKPYLGIVEKKLGTDGFPVMAVGSKSSLAYLFKDDTDGVTTFAENVKFFEKIKEDNGYFVFDSEKHTAYLKKVNGKFAAEMEVDKSKANMHGSSGYFTPFTTDDKDFNNSTDALELANSNKNYFGMLVETRFVQPKEGKVGTEPMTFEFGGDDDVWVFIDGVLVLDIGGVHGKNSGKIDFATGEITLPVNENGVSLGKTTIKDCFTAAGVSTDKFEGNTFKDYTEHDFKMFYFERGAYQTNCYMKLNLQTVPSGKAVVKKVVEGTARKADADYKFEIKKNDTLLAAGTKFEIVKDGFVTGEGTVSENGIFTLKDGEEARFDFTAADKVTVRELDVDADSVKVDGEEVTVDESKATPASTKNVGEATQFTFTNAYIDTKLEVGKTATVADYDNRTYTINVTADYVGRKVEEKTETVVADADVVLVFDTSGSMIYTDAAIVNAENSAAAYGMLSSLDTGKIYFTESLSGYEGTSVSASVGNRLLQTAKSGNTFYNIPTSYTAQYMFYDNGKWYIRNANREQTGTKREWVIWPFWSEEVPTYQYYILNRTDALVASKAVEVTANNCPKTIYTNRSEMLVKAAESFVNELSAGSNVAVVTFGDAKKSATKCGLTNVGTGKATILEKIEGATGVYNTATYPIGALDLAKGIYDADTNSNANYVVFFADGANDGDSVDTAADALKGKATVYAIGVGNSGNVISKVATDADHVISPSSATDLVSVFNAVSTEIKSETKTYTGKGTVTDYIDSRFVVVKSNGEPYENGAEVDDNGGVLHITNDATYIEWKDVEIGSGEGKTFEANFKVKAKDDFFGGNAIPTNGAASGVVIDGDKSAKFPQPTVNVKLLDFDVSGNESTVMLGEASTPEAFLQKVVDTFTGEEVAKPTSADIESLIANYNDASKSNLVSKEYAYGGDVVGKFVYELTATDNANKKTFETVENHATTVAMMDAEEYTLTIKFVPSTVAERIKDTTLVAPNNGGEAVTEKSCNGTYVLNVVPGQIKIYKEIKVSEIEWTDGDPIFTFELTHSVKQDDKTLKKSATKVVHFKNTDELKEKETFTLGIIFDGLEAGEYTVKELDTLGYKLVDISSADMSAYKNDNNEAATTLGTKEDGTIKTEAQATFVNEKVTKYFMDRDEIVNTVTKAADGTITISSNGSKETKEFATKEALDEYVRAENAKRGGQQ